MKVSKDKQNSIVVKRDDGDEETTGKLDLNPKKYKGKRDNVFMDFMALYTRSDHTDKSKRRSSSTANRTNKPSVVEM